MAKKKDASITIRISEQDKIRLEDWAKKEDCSISQIVRRFIQAKLDCRCSTAEAA